MRVDPTIRVFKQRCTQNLAVWMQRRGWLLSVLSFEGRVMWLQGTKAGRRVESQIRGLDDVDNACGVLMAEIAQVESKELKTAA